MTTIALKEEFTGNTVLAAVILMGSVSEAKLVLGEEEGAEYKVDFGEYNHDNGCYNHAERSPASIVWDFHGKTLLEAHYQEEIEDEEEAIEVWKKVKDTLVERMESSISYTFDEAIESFRAVGEEDAYKKFSPAFDFCMMVLDREVKKALS